MKVSFLRIKCARSFQNINLRNKLVAKITKIKWKGQTVEYEVTRFDDCEKTMNVSVIEQIRKSVFRVGFFDILEKRR
jgi:hypothetical protein